MLKGTLDNNFPRRGRILLVVVSLALFTTSSGWAGLCEELSPTSANVQHYGTDYLPRLDFHDGVAALATCSHDLPAVLPADMSFPIYGYNLQGAISGVRFRIFSTLPIISFQPAAGFTAIGSQVAFTDEDFWYLDVSLLAPTPCGPILLGEAVISVPEETVGFFVDLTGFEDEPAPMFIYDHTVELPVVTPRHGVYAGQLDLYHCQPPLCVEPHTPVTEFEPLQSGGLVIELGWKAGSGNFTMIRYRTDGLHPTSIFDGDLLTLMPSYPGQTFAIFHDDPQVVQYWYTAFSVTLEGEEVTVGSQLECDSFTTATVDESVAVESSTWGALKDRYR